MYDGFSLKCWVIRCEKDLRSKNIEACNMGAGSLKHNHIPDYHLFDFKNCLRNWCIRKNIIRSDATFNSQALFQSFCQEQLQHVATPAAKFSSFLPSQQASNFLEALLKSLDQEAPVGPFVPMAFRVLAPVKARAAGDHWPLVVKSPPGRVSQSITSTLDDWPWLISS